MVKAIAYARVKSDRIDARTLADLLRAKMIPETYIPSKEIIDLRDLVRRGPFRRSKTMFKNRIRAELAKRRLSQDEELRKGKLFAQKAEAICARFI